MHLQDTVNYDILTNSTFLYTWGNAVKNQTYTVYINGTIPGHTENFLEKKDVYRVGSSPVVNLAFLSGQFFDTNEKDATMVFSLAILFMFAAVFSRVNKVGAVIAFTGLTALFVFFGWIPQTVLSYMAVSVLVMFNAFYIFYKLGEKGGRET